MKSFPYKILFLCIFLPPVCYVFSLNGLEMYLQKNAEKEIDRIIIRNDSNLYDGRLTVKEEINQNISAYLTGKSFWYNLGISTDIQVKTKSNIIIYPSQLSEINDDFQQGTSRNINNYIDVGAENFKILNDGLDIAIEVRIRQNSWLSNSILVCYVFIALAILRFFIKKSLRRDEEIEQEQNRLIEELSGKLVSSENELLKIKEKENTYSENIALLKQEKENLSTDIDELLGEMERLENGLNDQKKLRETREEEVISLKNEIENLRQKNVKTKKKNKKQELADKRFKVLYKNLTFTEKAIEGFLDLSEDFQLKAEEIIHRINEDDSAVNVKRKVFSKGGKINVLETDFSYSGRIYYQKESKTKSTIIVVGTKKTQSQDLAFLKREYT